MYSSEVVAKRYNNDYNNSVSYGEVISVEGIPINIDYEQTSSRYPLTFNINEASARDYLMSHNWPLGLQDTLIKNLQTIPIRFFICDDSGCRMFILPIMQQF